MPKILLLEACTVNYGDERGGVIENAGALVTVLPNQSAMLVNIGRALYAAKGDDPTKGLKTAPAEVVKAAEARAKKSAVTSDSGDA